MDATTLTDRISALRGLGLTQAADILEQARTMERKLEIAYEHYRFLTDTDVHEYNKKLFEQTGAKGTYSRLRMTQLKDYGKVPPDDVLVALAQAQDRGCFDTFYVADLESVEILPDPLLLGHVDGHDNYFFITQWDDDVKISDILQADQGWVRPDGAG